MQYHSFCMGKVVNSEKVSVNLIWNVEIEEPMDIYKCMPEIIVEFHHILVSSLLSYMFCLKIVEMKVYTF